MRAALLLIPALLLAGCGKFDDGLEGPAPVPGTKADWRVYGNKPDHDILVDVNSISHYDDYASDSYVYSWMWQKYKADRVDPKPEAGSEDYGLYYSKAEYRDKYSRQAIDCQSGKMALIAVETRDKDDDLVERFDVPGYQWDFQQPVPGSYGEDYVRQICKIMAEKDAKKDKEE
ncbi:hypothetical protein [Chitinilyticum piscinae]|uniref:Lipoprotein n=1 Tax=Chitinilyticum piscinae TaxID=2866724 RepID=A0A8J7FMU7_9NEIS|nr:hypothetical protein [Chitinilyticum piscinae]MBE9609074.1 hypothetical protein [Chitinilyticum piscinae]